jgi:transcriptional antiterminator NusG
MAEEPQAQEQAAASAASTASVFAVKTTANQERSVANLIAMVARKENYDIRSILVPEELKGYVLVESPMHEIVEHAIQNIPHAKAVVKGASSIAEVQHFLAPKPVVTGISEGDIVELISGPFKGEKARVKRVDTAKEEITVELSEAMVPIPVTVRGDIVRVLSKEETRK